MKELFNTSSLQVKKIWMGLTGIFLNLFLIAHLTGNLQLLIPGEEGRLRFNEYAKFMTSNPFVIFLSICTYLSIIIHTITGIFLSARNRRKRGERYKSEAFFPPNTSIPARIMDILGLFILIFLIIHLSDFWYRFKFTEMPLDPVGNKDLYQLCVKEFSKIGEVLTYVLLMVPLGFHLYHGFMSQFVSIGVFHKGIYRIVSNKTVRLIYSIIISGGFAIIPIIVYLRETM